MKTLLRATGIGLIHFLLAGTPMVQGAGAPRDRELLDWGWKFHLGNEWGNAQSLAKAGTGSGPASTSFSDASWRTVQLPHDWAVELPFDQRADGSHGFKALGRGFPQNSVAWYRRTFELPRSDAGKRLWVEFDGAFRDCTVFLNGWFVGHHDSGYNSFRYDITDLANCGGRNVLAVKVDATEVEGWFYEGAGIYRHVWLEKNGPVAIVPDGVFVYTTFKDNVPEGPATVCLETTLSNTRTNPAEVKVEWDILDGNGRRVVQASTPQAVNLSGAAATLVKQTATLPEPELWSPEKPRLYKLITQVWQGNQVLDRVETEFGVRTVGFDVDKGFLLNGQPYELKGTCNHQDHAGVGAALPDQLQYFRVGRLKEMGANAYRTSHNPPTPELLEACDRLGMLVMDENRLLGSDVVHMNRLERLIRRDRNHPSVVIWSVANEEFSVQGTPIGRRVARTMQDFIKQLDPTRPVTYPAPVGNEFNGINEVIEVRGWNYHVGQDMDDYHKAHPQQPNVGTEQGSTVGTRGIYANDAARGYVSAYDDNAPQWAQTAETWWSYFAPRPWLSGGFVWTGFDYRGEPTPYGWPCINSHFGIMDTCGYPKDNYYYYQSWWTKARVCHILPHWNWPGKEGQDIDVRVLSNAEEVELSLNGRSLGKKTMPVNGEAKWLVKYEPGTLAAKGYKGGKVAVSSEVATTAPAAQIHLRSSRSPLQADGEDVSVITVAVLDERNRVVPVATNLVQFELSGPGRILGVGNGDPSCHEPDVYVARQSMHAMAIKDWRWQRINNPYDSKQPETAAQYDDTKWTVCDVQGRTRQLGEREHGVFRGKFELSAKELEAPAIELGFGSISGDGFVYVNGQKVGESRDPESPPVFDVKSLLHAGENHVAVVVANYGGGGGISEGVNLRIQEPAQAPQWRRSVFNGLAQIIVQSTKTPGQLSLTARSPGLTPASLTIPTQPCTARPAVP
jgi:beta-galactosidase